jgi:hypothetical protein
MGVPSPSVGKRSFKDGRSPGWGVAQVRRMLHDASYKGEGTAWRYRKRTPHSRIYIEKPAEEWIKLPPETTPAIVDEDLWQRAQERLARNKGEKARNEKRPFMLRGFIQCAGCGEKMYPTTHHRNAAYRCKSQTVPGLSSCGARCVPADDVERWAWKQVVAILQDPAIILSAITQKNEAGVDQSLALDLAGANNALARVESGIRRLIAKYRDTEDEELALMIDREIAQARAEQKGLRATIAEHEMRLSAQRPIDVGRKALKLLARAIGEELRAFTCPEQAKALGAIGARVVAIRGQYDISIDPFINSLTGSKSHRPGNRPGGRIAALCR